MTFTWHQQYDLGDCVELQPQGLKILLPFPLEPWFDKTWKPGQIELVKN